MSILSSSSNSTKNFLAYNNDYLDFRFYVYKKNQVQCSVHSHAEEYDWKFITTYHLD